MDLFQLLFLQMKRKLQVMDVQQVIKYLKKKVKKLIFLSWRTHLQINSVGDEIRIGRRGSMNEL